MPLAGLAYAVSVLLHRLSEEETQPVAPAVPRLTPVLASETAGETTAYASASMPTGIGIHAIADRACPNCGAALTAAAYGAAKRWGHCQACKGQVRP